MLHRSEFRRVSFKAIISDQCKLEPFPLLIFAGKQSGKKFDTFLDCQTEWSRTVVLKLEASEKQMLRADKSDIFLFSVLNIPIDIWKILEKGKRKRLYKVKKIFKLVKRIEYNFHDREKTETKVHH